jgi:dihydroorotase
MSVDIYFSDVRLIDPANGIDQQGSLLVREGRILDLGANIAIPGDAERITADGAVLCPGLVDMRAALGEPGYEYRETIASAAIAAAAGGITTLAALPDSLPAIDDPALVRLLRARGEETASLTILPYGAITKGCKGEEMAELGLLHEAGAVAFTDGSRAIASARLMRLALSYARGFDAMIVQHPEDPSLAGGGTATEGAQATRLGLPGIPAAAEAILIARDIRLAALTGGAVHFAPTPNCRRHCAPRPTARQSLPLWPTARSTPSHPITSRATPTTSGCHSPWPPPVAAAWRRCSALRWPSSIAAWSACPR